MWAAFLQLLETNYRATFDKFEGRHRVADTRDGRFLGLDMTCPFNLLPQCPALSLPTGLAENGLPVGLQIFGHPYADEKVL
ncbi:amidase family protein [Ensifer sp. ENS09]|uniref:amidase family protein n=1 Tax=Ensifer sp. ENS09 TaxID=2769263 RepID=UPI00352DAEC4